MILCPFHLYFSNIEINALNISQGAIIIKWNNVTSVVVMTKCINIFIIISAITTFSMVISIIDRLSYR